MRDMSETKTEKKEATSIKINPTVWKDAKIEAIKENKTVSQLVEEAIEKYIREHGKK
jgi:predicted HicB family RNase H-like nuclease